MKFLSNRTSSFVKHVNLRKKKGFGTLPVTFPVFLVNKNVGDSSVTIGSVLAWGLNITMKCLLM